jgi:hypothetical protein
VAPLVPFELEQGALDIEPTVHSDFGFWLRFGYPDSQMNCAECPRLLAQYETLKRDYATAVQALEAGRHRSSAREYIQLKIAVDATRRDSERAETELLQHKREHAKGKHDWSPATLKQST